MSRRSAILLTLLVTACAPQAPLPTLPGTSNFMMGRDPIVVIGQSMVVFFRAPQANQPAAAARAIAELEWLADTTPRNPRWQQCPWHSPQRSDPGSHQRPMDRR